MPKNRLQESRVRCALALAALVAVAAACADGEARFDDLPSPGSAGATSVPVGGSSSQPEGQAGKPGVAGSAGRPHQAGTGGGETGSGGEGTGTPAVETFSCAGKVPDQPVVTRFDGFMGSEWKSPGNLDGGGYVYPDSHVLAAGDFLRFEAQVDDHTGIGAWISGCVDASKFAGVRLTVYGDAGPTGSVSFFLVTNRTKAVDEANSVGGCIPEDASDSWQSCRPPLVTLPVSAESKTHDVPWSAFTGGLPTATTDGSDILALQWSFDWLGETPYWAQLTVDNLEFFTPGDAASGADGARP